MTRRPSLSAVLAEQLRQMILLGELAPGQRLPSEADLAAQFGVSRVTVREALHSLHQQGLVIRQHGVGSFVSPNPYLITAGLERLESYTATIRRSGARAEDVVLDISPAIVETPVAQVLGVAPGSGAFRLSSLRLADGVPVIYCVEIIPHSVVADLQILERRRNYDSLIDFFAAEVGTVLATMLVAVEAVEAPDEVASFLGVPVRRPLLFLYGPGFDSQGRPLYYSQVFVRSDKLRFSVVRRLDQYRLANLLSQVLAKVRR